MFENMYLFLNIEYISTEYLIYLFIRMMEIKIEIKNSTILLFVIYNYEYILNEKANENVFTNINRTCSKIHT